MINTKTEFFFSISKNTSNRGAIYYNDLFTKKKKNFIYIPISIKSSNQFDQFLKFLKKKNINFAGSSISMPFKERVLKFIDVKDISVRQSKNANTIVDKKNMIKGYNTDFLAASEILKKNCSKNILIIGSGALSKSFLASNKHSNFFIFNRSKKKFLLLKKTFKTIKVASLKILENCNELTIVNCTPDYSNTLKKFLKKLTLVNVKCIINCSLSNNFEYLKKIAFKHRIIYISGENFNKTQRKFQEKIYLSK